MKVRELLSGPEKWTRKVRARNADLEGTDPESDEAVCWCIYGAFNRCYPNSHNEWLVLAGRVIELTGHTSPITWNDAPTTTFEDVKKLVTELDI